MAIDLNHIHDILSDAVKNPEYTKEARISARDLARAIGQVWQDGRNSVLAEMKRPLEPVTQHLDLD